MLNNAFFFIYVAGIIYVILFSILYHIFKVRNTFIFLIASFVSLFLSLFQMPKVKKSVDSIVGYSAVKITINFDKNLTDEEQKNDATSIIKYFNDYKKQYLALKGYPKGKPMEDKYAYTVASGRTMPHYWKSDAQTLTIYLSSELNTKQINTLKKILKDRFFPTVKIPKAVSVISTDEPLLVSMLLNSKNTIYKKEIKLDENFSSLSFTKTGRDELLERKAICSVDFKLREDYWDELFEKVWNKNSALGLMLGTKSQDKEEIREIFYDQLSGINLEIKFNEHHYSALIYHDQNMSQYLGIKLETYQEEPVEENTSKPYILFNNPLLDPYTDVKKDCFKEQIMKYPMLKSIITEKTFFKDFKYQPTTITVEKEFFNPSLNNVKRIENETY